MDLVPTDAEVAKAERIYNTAYDADFGRGYGMRRALESFLQGRAKPAQEEIGRLRGALELMVQYLEMPISVQMTKQQLIIKLRAAIRASKGEKT